MANDQVTHIDSSIEQETNENKLLKQEYDKKNIDTEEQKKIRKKEYNKQY